MSDGADSFAGLTRAELDRIDETIEMGAHALPPTGAGPVTPRTLTRLADDWVDCPEEEEDEILEAIHTFTSCVPAAVLRAMLPDLDDAERADETGRGMLAQLIRDHLADRILDAREWTSTHA